MALFFIYFCQNVHVFQRPTSVSQKILLNLPGRIFSNRTLFLGLRCAIFQSGIAIQTLILMQSSEKKKKKNKRRQCESNSNARLIRHAPLTTMTQRRRCRNCRCCAHHSGMRIKPQKHDLLSYNFFLDFPGNGLATTTRRLYTAWPK